MSRIRAFYLSGNTPLISGENSSFCYLINVMKSDFKSTFYVFSYSFRFELLS